MILIQYPYTSVLYLQLTGAYLQSNVWRCVASLHLHALPHISSTFAVSLWHPERGNQDSTLAKHRWSRSNDGDKKRRLQFYVYHPPVAYALLALDPFALVSTLVSGKH